MIDPDPNSIPTAGSASSAIFSLLLPGSAGGVARQIFHLMAPTANDSTEVRVGKDIFRWTIVVAGGTVWAVVVLGA